MLAPDTLLKSRYRIVRKLGSGGQGDVYEAQDENLSCRVAVKENTLDHEDYRRAFIREAKLMGNLRHAALVRVLEHFALKSALYLVMEYIPGEDLAHLMHERRNAPFPLETVLDWADVLLDALDYLHQLSPQDPIIHRDIKPANLKLSTRGEIILLDFGLARGSAGDMSTMQSKRSVIGYTPGYGPLEQSLRHPIWESTIGAQFPEQWAIVIRQPTDPRSDLYSLAATLYHLLTGEIPPDAPLRAGAVWAGRPDPLRPAHALVATVPIAVSNLLTQALSLERGQRPANASEMGRALVAARAGDRPASGSVLTVASVPPVKDPEQVETLPLTVTEPKFGVLGRCKNSVRSVAFSPDGRYVASGSNDNIVRLWDVHTGDERLLGPNDGGKSGFAYISSVAIAPDGATVISCGNDKTIRSWGITEAGNRILTRFKYPVRSVAFAPDGETIAAGCSDGTVFVYELDIDQLDILGKCEGVVWSVAFSPDSQDVAVESDDGAIRIWNLRSRVMRSMPSPDTDLRALAFSPDGRQIAAGGSDSVLRLWEVATGESRVVGSCEGAIRSVAYAPNGKHIATAGDDRTVRVWDPKTGHAEILGACDDVVSAVAFAPGGLALATGSWDNTVRLWKAL